MGWCILWAGKYNISITLEPTQLTLASTDISNEASRNIMITQDVDKE
jgi:hypothetical protein